MAKKTKKAKSVSRQKTAFNNDTKNLVSFITILFLLLTILASMLVVWYRVGSPINAAGF